MHEYKHVAGSGCACERSCGFVPICSATASEAEAKHVQGLQGIHEGAAAEGKENANDFAKAPFQ